MMRTMMVTGEAGQTRAVVLPLRLIPKAPDDVLHRTDIRADAALDAQPTVNDKPFIIDQMLREVTA